MGQQRQARGGLYDAQADAARPFTLSPAQARSIGHPELAGSTMSPGTFRNAQSDASKLQGDLATHFGGEKRMLSLGDAQAIGNPSLAGSLMSNDEFQRELAARGHDVQSGSNNAATNRTRIKATGMTNATSRRNADERNLTSIGNNKRTNLTRRQNAQLMANRPRGGGSADSGVLGVTQNPDGSYNVSPQFGTENPAPANQTPTGATGTVTVQLPDGRTMSGPASQLDALQEAYGGKVKVIPPKHPAASVGAR